MRWPTRYRVRPWHPWFAWHPVNVQDEWIWLERVERQVDAYGATLRFYDYRRLEP